MNDDTTPTESETDPTENEPRAATSVVGVELAAAADDIDTGDPTADARDGARDRRPASSSAQRRRRPRRRRDARRLRRCRREPGRRRRRRRPDRQRPGHRGARHAKTMPRSRTTPQPPPWSWASRRRLLRRADIVEVPSGETVPVRLVPASVDQVVDSGLTVDAANVGQSRLLRWQDGFLSIRTTFEPQPLPTELPQEITDQFPPEVVELFPDGLPPDDPGSDADPRRTPGCSTRCPRSSRPTRTSTTRSTPSRARSNTSVRFSTDGLEWADLDVDFPVDDNYLEQCGDHVGPFRRSSSTPATRAGPGLGPTALRRRLGWSTCTPRPTS